jgi:ribose 5-phosphate isomerase B
MRIAISLDHTGFALKENIITYLGGLGHKVLDLGPHNTNPVDLPNYAEPVGLAIQRGQAERGILKRLQA